MNAMRRIGCSFIFAIGMCVFAGSAMAFDLGGMLDKIDKAVKGPESDTERAIREQDERYKREQTNDAALKKAKLEKEEARKQSERADAASAVGFCDRVQATGVYQKYAKMTGDAVRGGYYSALKNDGFDNSAFKLKTVPRERVFDTTDGMLLQWILTKRPSFVDYDHYDIGGPAVKTAVAECFDQLLQTDSAYIFLKPDMVSNLRKSFDAANKATTPAKVVRKVTASGEIVEEKVDAQKDEKAFAAYNARRDQYISGDSGVPGNFRVTGNFPHWLALLYGGEKVLNTTSTEFMKNYEQHLSEDKVASEAERNNEVTRKNQEKNQELENAQNVARIKKGDYSQINSCTEIMGYGSPYHNVLVTPPKTLFWGTGFLKEHSDSEELLNVSKLSFDLMKLKFDKNTRVFNGENRALKGEVLFVGNYSSNDRPMKLSIDIPVFQVTCVQY